MNKGYAVACGASSRGEKNIEIIPIWAVSHNAAGAIANAAKALDVDSVIIGASRRSAFYHMLRGHVVKGLDEEAAAHLPPHDQPVENRGEIILRVSAGS